MTTTTSTTGYLVDRTGSPRFINRTAADTWLTTATDQRALQCPDCTEIHDTADTAFDCCRTGAAIPVRPVVGDPDLFETVPAGQLDTETADRLAVRNQIVKTYYIHYQANDGTSGIARIESERKPSWAQVYAVVPGFVTGRVLAEVAV